MEMILIFGSITIVLLASIILRLVYAHYKKVGVRSEITGKEAALKILKHNDLKEIEVHKISGSLSDYYDSRNDEICLSEDIYELKSIASVSVAAHECGHAIQYSEGYKPIKIRNFLVPIVNIGNSLGYIAIVISFLASLSKLFLVGIILVSFAILFQLLTLPIEINASKRGKKQLLDLKIIDEKEAPSVSRMLMAAAFTYLAGLISSILEIVRLIYIFSGNDD